ncbi:MAG: permease [Gemmataceae bacterium]
MREPRTASERISGRGLAAARPNEQPPNRASTVDQSDFQLKIYDFILRFTGIFFEALPWVVIGAAFAGLVQELPSRRAPAVMLALGTAILILTVSPLSLAANLGIAAAAAALVFAALLLAQPLVNRALALLGKHRWLAIALSPLLGLVNPMCDCGVLVVMRRLLRKGLPLSCCIAFILAGPIINLLVAATTYKAFYPKGASAAWWMLGLRMGLGYLTAVVAAHVVERQVRRWGVSKLVLPSLQPPKDLPSGKTEEEPWPTLGRFLTNVSETALHDFVDVIVLLILGALLAAGARAFINPEQLGRALEHPLLAIGGMIAVAFVITLCSEADAFVAAALVPPMRPGALLAFLVFGPMIDLKIFFMYTRVFRPRLMWTIILCVAVQVFVYASVVHFLWERTAPGTWSATPTATTAP